MFKKWNPGLCSILASTRYYEGISWSWATSSFCKREKNHMETSLKVRTLPMFQGLSIYWRHTQRTISYNGLIAISFPLCNYRIVPYWRFLRPFENIVSSPTHLVQIWTNKTFVYGFLYLNHNIIRFLGSTHEDYATQRLLCIKTSLRKFPAATLGASTSSWQSIEDHPAICKSNKHHAEVRSGEFLSSAGMTKVALQGL